MLNDADVVATYEFLRHTNETEIRLIDPHRERIPQSIFVHTKEEFLKICQENDGKYNIYAGINERKGKGTTSNDVTTIKTVVVDIDAAHPKDEAATDEEILRCEQITNKIITDCINAGFKKPIKNMSGNGYQLWFALKEIQVTDTNRAEVTDKLHTFQKKIKNKYESSEAKIDIIGDLARVIKVIGTTSIKGKNTPDRPNRLSKCCDTQFSRDVDSDLTSEILNYASTPKKDLKYFEPTPKTTKEIERVCKGDQKIRKLIDGDTSGYISRSEAEMALIVKLIEYQLPKDQCFEIMASSKIGKWNEAHERYRELTYQNGVKFEESQKSGDEPTEPDYELEAKIREFTTNKDKIEDVWNVLDKLVVGESNNKKAIFLILLSHKFENPTGVRVLGNSSTGKTHMVREVLKLFPENAKIILGYQSEKALIHRKPDYIEQDTWIKVTDLTGKILWFLEEKGSEKAYDVLRPILSRDQKEIVYEFTDKSAKSGSLKTTQVKIKGAPAFVTTSTKLEILGETGTRVFSISPDETEESTKAVVDYKLKKEETQEGEPDIRYIQSYIERLKPISVWIPYAKLIDINTTNTRARRDIDKILTLIKAHALFNQTHREIVRINEKDKLLANEEDLIGVLKIIEPLMEATTSNVAAPIIRFYDKIVKVVSNEPTIELTHKNIAESLRMSQSTVRVYCPILVDAGWMSESQVGREKVYGLREKTKYVHIKVLSATAVLLAHQDIIQKGYNIDDKSIEEYVREKVCARVLDENVIKKIQKMYGVVLIALTHYAENASTEPEMAKFGHPGFYSTSVALRSTSVSLEEERIQLEDFNDFETLKQPFEYIEGKPTHCILCDGLGICYYIHRITQSHYCPLCAEAVTKGEAVAK